MRRVFVLAAIALLALSAWWFHQREGEARRVRSAGLPTVEGRIPVAGAQAPLRILRDARGVPHVEAESERDAYFGLGFAQAQDRLGQMVSMLRAADGRSAEILGPEALAADRMARVLGFRRLAARAASDLDGRTRRLLEAYAAGVTARLSRVHAGLAAPPAQLTPADLPTAWTPADSFAVLKVWAWGLGGSIETTLVLDDILRRLGPERARPFFPAGVGVRPAGDGPPALVRRGTPAAPKAESTAGTPRRAAFRDPLRDALGMRAPGLGSSAFVLAGSASASGRPLLAGDTHLAPTVPAHLHLAHLRAGAFEVAGAAVPGVPVFWSGGNGRVAWAATAARASVQDLFVETLDRSREAARAHDGRGWRRLEVREESIPVRGQEPSSVTVEIAPHGPLLNALLERDREPLALAFAGARPGDGIGPFLRAARAADGEAWLEALADHHEPALVLAWAAGDGDAGRTVAGWIPQRSLPSGLVPVSGRSGWATWQAGIPASRLPRERLEGKRGFLIASDGARPGGEIEWLWRSGERRARIAERLEALVGRGSVDLRTLAEVQLDRRAAAATAVLEPALALAGTPAQLPAEEREIQSLLAEWDGDTGPGSVGAAVYHVFLDDLARALLEPSLGGELYARYTALPHANVIPLVARVLAAAHEGWAREGVEAPDEWARQRVAEAVRAALRRTWLRFGVRLGPNRDKWRWGELHTLRFEPFGLLRWPGEGFAAIPHPGDSSTIDAGGYDWNDPFEVRSASTFRFAIDTAEPETWLAHLAPGQAEALGHPHRADGIEAWRAGRPQLLSLGAVRLNEQAAARLQLVPQAAP